MKGFFKKAIAIVLTLAIAFSGMVIEQQKQSNEVKAATNYQLVWSDEFNGSELDRSNWNVEVNGNGGGNNELQYYLDNTNNINVSNGTLKINARRESYGGKNYTSGRITTQGKRKFTYGRIEARMKLPSFTGAWPAFWMLGETISSEGWPSCGEIDIMEAINTEDKTYGTVHWSYQGFHAESGGNISGMGRTGWHVYAIEWDANEIKWYVDNSHFFTQKIDDASEMQEFRREHFILFNLAIGGNWPGFSVDDSAFPANSTMEVDYVRVYQDTGEVATTQPSVSGRWSAYYGTDWSGASGSYTSQSTVEGGIVMNMSSIGNSMWGVQAFCTGIPYSAGNTHKYKCTITSNVTRTIFVKVAGDNNSEISGEYIQVAAGVPYNYEKDINIVAGYAGVLDLYFALGKCEGEAIADNTACTININNVSFNTIAETTTPNSQNVTLSDFVGTYSWGTDYTYQKEAYANGASTAHRYLVMTYTGDISSLRLERGPLQTEQVVWFAQNEQGTFKTANGEIVPQVGNSTTVIIDLASSGLSGEFFNDFHVHTGATGSAGSVTINDAWLTATYPSEVPTSNGQEVTTAAPATTVAPETTTSQTINPSNINWSSIPYAEDGAQGGALNNKYKFYCVDGSGSLVNIQSPEFATEPGLYVSFSTAISSCTLSGNTIQGAGVLLHLSAIKEGVTEFNVTDTTGTHVCYVYYEGETETPTETPTEAPTEAPTEVPTEAPTEAPTTYSVTLDGEVVATVEEGSTYTFPKTAKVGYYGNGKLYKKGSTYTVTKDIEFYTVSITTGTGASIKWTEPSGMRFNANLTCSDTGFYDTLVKKTGMLIAPYDFYSEDENLDFNSEYIYLNVENSGWTGKTGAFGGALASISPNNYKRMYIARAYVTVEYADGSEATVYSNMSGVRSVGGVAQTMKDTASVYNNLSTAQKALLETYILAGN